VAGTAAYRRTDRDPADLAALHGGCSRLSWVLGWKGSNYREPPRTAGRPGDEIPHGAGRPVADRSAVTTWS
jgi:hypothetical protein